MRIKEDVINVLADSTVSGTELALPDRQLDRKLYTDVNKVLTSVGGKWNRKAKAHIFSIDVAEVIEEIIQTGEYTDAKKEFQFFETPLELAIKMARLAMIEPGDSVLEPSAGQGAIAKLIPECDCIELNPENRKVLSDMGMNVVGEDFLKETERYDVIVGNPPFCKQQDVDHINHMMDLANKRVVAIGSASILFRDNKKTVAFRERVESLGGTIEALPEGSFKPSGTNVNTCIVCVDMN